MIIKYDRTARVWMGTIIIDGEQVVVLNNDFRTLMDRMLLLATGATISAGGFVSDGPVSDHDLPTCH